MHVQILERDKSFHHDLPGHLQGERQHVHLVPSLGLGVRSRDVPSLASGVATKQHHGLRQPSFDLQAKRSTVSNYLWPLEYRGHGSAPCFALVAAIPQHVVENPALGMTWQP